MAEYITIPDPWTELTYELGPKRADRPFTEELDGLWASNDDRVTIETQHSVDANGKVSYPVIVKQMVGDDTAEAIVQSHGMIADDRKEAEERVREFIDQFESGEHRLRTLAVEFPDSSDESRFVQFYTISDSELPEGVTAQQLIDVIQTDAPDDAISDLPDDVSRKMASEQMISIDVFPRPVDEVERTE